ncbi:MAG: PQQ-dependent sugar dehydrogenase, partial [Chitinophagaceae bacterium]
SQLTPNSTNHGGIKFVHILSNHRNMHRNATLRLSIGVLLMLTLIFSPILLTAQPRLVYEPAISGGLSSPIDIVNAGDGTNRLFVVQQAGTIRVYNQSHAYLGNLVTVAGVTFVGGGDERGLLSMAFHPDYETNRFFYVYYNTNVAGVDYINIARYQTRADNPNLADDTSRKVMLTIQKPFTNHNGGRLQFGQDGKLYFATGDGGSGDDPFNNSQNGNSLLGKMIRLHVLTGDSAYVAPYYSIPLDNPYVADPAIRDEIFALGLRNPFRWSFDRLTGDMWIGDVGQDQVEEIDYRAASATAGVNYGWACFEGTIPNESDACTPGATYIDPIFQYPNPNPGAAAVTGGQVYRGSAYPAMYGYYVAADVYSGTHYKIKSNGSGGWFITSQAGPGNIVAFGEAENGEVYAVNIAGSISHLTTTTLVPIKLLSLNAIRKNDHVQVNWKTAYESDLRSFEIEYSTDGRNYQLAQSVTPRNSINGFTYSVQHFLATTGVVYYRLKMVNADGSFEYSPVVTTSSDKQLNGAVIPGLVRNNRLLLTVYEPFEQLKLVSALGQTLYTRNIRGMSGFNEITLPDLPAGTYVVQLAGKERQYSQRIVVAR